MADEQGVDLLELEEELKSVFDTVSAKAKSISTGDQSRAVYARAAAETADSIVNLRRQRIAEQQGGKVDKLKMG